MYVSILHMKHLIFGVLSANHVYSKDLVKVYPLAIYFKFFGHQVLVIKFSEWYPIQPIVIFKQSVPLQNLKTIAYFASGFCHSSKSIHLRIQHRLALVQSSNQDRQEHSTDYLAQSALPDILPWPFFRSPFYNSFKIWGLSLAFIGSIIT